MDFISENKRKACAAAFTGSSVAEDINKNCKMYFGLCSFDSAGNADQIRNHSKAPTGTMG